MEKTSEVCTAPTKKQIPDVNSEDQRKALSSFSALALRLLFSELRRSTDVFMVPSTTWRSRRLNEGFGEMKSHFGHGTVRLANGKCITSARLRV